MITVLGASGFIGSSLVQLCKQKGFEVCAPVRGDPDLFNKSLGDVIYCIGYTSDFRKHPLETMEAHVSLLVNFLKSARFDSFLYLSSTRVYEGASSATEPSMLSVNPNEPDHIFNLSKLAGEAACLSQSNQKIRVARVSNVVGRDFNSDNFLFSVLRDVITKHKVTLHTTPDTAKDYIWVDDVLDLILNIVRFGNKRIYNVASGKNISNLKLLERARQVLNFDFTFSKEARRIVFPEIEITQSIDSFGFKPSPVLDKLESLIMDFKTHLKNEGAHGSKEI